jgi:hypothetical protein
MDSGSILGEDNPTTSPSGQTSQELRRQRQIVVGVSVVLVLFIVLIGIAVWFLLQPNTRTAQIRDVFIILMALESLLLGLVLVILIIQLARLINLLQNEIKPILDSTNETVSTLRGTTAFLSNNLVEPVVKMNEYFAGIQQALRVIGLARRKKE